ncbi:MAG TPA: PfkB family carbohydrate kinase [Anaerolineae bacterium]|nr:PfkB family carbohydrate kinase [Anaerolineae bacterium]HQH38402.1 PfkB family carbohydrate kinase [Anaerolineae bacterium]
MDRVLAPIDYLVIGHVTHDILADGRRVLGGTVSYASLTAAALGCTVGIVTSAGADVDLSTLERIAAVVRYPAPATTTFQNVYVDGHREQYVYSFAASLTPQEVPPAWLRSPIVHIGPIMRECAPALVEHFHGKAFIGITPQGWMRASDRGGRVFPIPWAEAAHLLPLASAVVLSIEDIGGDWDLAVHFAAQTRILVVTCGWDGGTIFIEGTPTTFPAMPVTQVDPTGAGDIFATAFFIALASGTPPLTATHYAACLAAYSVTRVGLASTPQPDEVVACSPYLAKSSCHLAPAGSLT